jgi:ankyrin repeat protein
MGDSESKSKAYGVSSSLLGKKEESTPLFSPTSSGALEPTQEESIEVRVDYTSDKLFLNDSARIFEFVARGEHKELSDLLTNRTTEIHFFDKEGNTALHRAVTSACQVSDSDASFYKCVDLLMSCEQIKVNLPNNKGYTATGLAVHNLHKTCIEHMLKHPSANRLHLDYYPGDRESTVREIIKEIYPELESLLPDPLMESLDSTDRNTKLLAALQREEYCIFKDILVPNNNGMDIDNLNLDSNNLNPWYNEPYYSSLLEIACQMKKRKQFVQLLLDIGADPKIVNRVTGMPLIHATARSGNFEVLQLLLEKEGRKEGRNDTELKDNEQRTIVHWLARVSAGKQEEKQRLQNCLTHLLSPDCSWNVDTEDRDCWGNTALYIAVERGFRDRAKLLLSKGADVRVFERGSKMLLSTSQLILKEFLNDCLESNDKPLNSIDLQLKLKYQSFMGIVPSIAESKFHSNLLAHPVMSTFLILRWEELKFVFFADVAFYSAFLFFLTSYILLSEPYNTVNDGGAANNTKGPSSFNDINITSDMTDSNDISQLNRRSQIFLWLSLMVLSFLLTLRETAQLIVHKWVYVRSPENWMEILLITATYISCSGVVDGMKIKTHFSAVAILLGWFEFLLLLGRLPQLSVNQKMFKKVSLTFLSFMMGYVPLLIAFALSFYILFKAGTEPDDIKYFSNPLLSLTKTIIMFSGEVEASNLSLDIVPFTSHVIFLLFVVLVAIVLLNLLTGLAVSDTEQIAQIAEKLCLESRASLLFKIEKLLNALPKSMKPDIEPIEKTFVIYPNQHNKIKSASVQSLLSIISEKKRPEEKDKSIALQNDWRMFKEKLSELQILQEKLQKKFESILDE